MSPIITPAGVKLRADTVAFISSEKKLLIGGEAVDALIGEAFTSENPATGQVLCTLAAAASADVDRAVAAAREAFQTVWRDFDAAKRGELLWKVAGLLEENLEHFAEIETLDNGKPLSFARADVANAIKHFRYYAGWTTKIEGATIPVSKPALVYTRREPVGVVGLITPWNFPLLMAAWKLAPALACGNAAVIKPAEQTSLTTLRLGQLMLEAGIPSGVVNVVTGMGVPAGSSLAAHIGVNKISFTGSTGVGRHIMRAAADSNLKRVSLELGGKNPQVIFADANLDAALESLHWDCFFNSGQECTAGARLYVERPIYQRVIERLKQQACQLRVGNGLTDVELGPVISREQLNTILGYIESGKAQGAKLIIGGERLRGELAAGYFLPPTIFAHEDDTLKIVQEEIFGPVVAVAPFDSFEEVIERANQTIYGLAAGVWTENLKKAHRFAHAIQAGVVWINGYDRFDPAAPFGGYKQSGFGREMGKEAIELYTQAKTIWVGM
jgi:aldehyde dehydrogenase (NAD+)/phenylacetaldehyde dehydrogenase